MWLHLGPKEVKDVFSILKDCAAEANENTSVELQVLNLNKLLRNNMMVVSCYRVNSCIGCCQMKSYFFSLYLLSSQITYGVLFSLVVTFVSDVLSTSGEKASLSSDSSFRHEFHDLVSCKICLYSKLFQYLSKTTWKFPF